MARDRVHAAQRARARHVHQARRARRPATGVRPRARSDRRHRPGVSPPHAIALMRARARGRLTYGELGRALQMRELRDTSAMYAGAATSNDVLSLTRLRLVTYQ